jgi:hypothetical protein
MAKIFDFLGIEDFKRKNGEVWNFTDSEKRKEKIERILSYWIFLSKSWAFVL